MFHNWVYHYEAFMMTVKIKDTVNTVLRLSHYIKGLHCTT